MSGRLGVERTVAGLRRRIAELRAKGLSIGLAPTMGALHAGHVSLVDAGRARGDAVVATIFVNPTQFGPNEDFAAYPRDEAADFALLEKSGAALVFAPDVREMYPEPGLTTVHVAELTSGLCGPFRPGHFDGVATVVTKLFLASLPDRAYFGEKDYQQLQVVRRLARDLKLPIEVVGCPTVRESDGLAMSSRNRYLNPAERAAAPAMHCSLIALAEAVSAGADCRAAEVEARATLLTAGFGPVDYVAVVDAESLAPVDRVTRPSRALAAAQLGKARLIDNVAVAAAASRR